MLHWSERVADECVKSGKMPEVAKITDPQPCEEFFNFVFSTLVRFVLPEILLHVGGGGTIGGVCLAL